MIAFFALFWEHTLLYLKYAKVSFFSYAAINTALGVMLMMVSIDIWIYYFVITLALLQKHFLLLQGRHLFNPSNFALIVGLLLFYKSTHIVMGQLGDEVWLAWITIALALPILYRVDRWIIPLAFVLFYILLQYAVIVHYDPVMIFEEVYFRFYSISFLLFVFFMLTDPVTTPGAAWKQIMFALFVASGATLLDYIVGFRVQHLFMSLFLLTPIFRLLDVWQGINVQQRFFALCIIFLALGAIIYIEIQPPYYFEMEG